MGTRRLETDYLVVGCGAAGMAFVDALVADSGADVVMVDRRHAPGGHWNDAYPFVRLHQPSSYYGVNSLPLGHDALQEHGLNRGFYEQAGAPEICAYFDRVMRERLLPTGRVRWLPMCEYAAPHRVASRLTGETFEVAVRRKVVDATYLEPSIPATTAPPFEVEEGVRCIPVGALARLSGTASGFTVVGAGKTAMDACLWLLQSGVPAEDLRWIRPRDGWLQNRALVQGGDQVGRLVEGLAMQMEAAAQADSPEDLYARLAACGFWLRLDEDVMPSMYKAPIASVAEVEELRRIRDVVRLGHVRRAGAEAIALEGGTVAMRPGHVLVHCATVGLTRAPAVPIFDEARITLQPVRVGLIPFNAALVGFIEATGRDTAAKNRLCPPNRLPDAPLDWLRGTMIGSNADYLWSKEADIAAWLERARLNPMRGVRAKAQEPRMRRDLQRYVGSVKPALARLHQLLQGSAAKERAPASGVA